PSARPGRVAATAAHQALDDGARQQVDLPHDWAVGLPFRQEPISAFMTEEDPAAAHGYKPLGTSFPQNSVGWYRRTLQIPASDLGKRISLVFDGVFRECIVFCNGHIVGRHASGYCGFEVDLSEVLDYGKPNIIAIRVDATLGEGWFYEGAGIYRHVWLQKTDPLHIPQDGVFVRGSVQDGNATAQLSTEVRNDGTAPRQCVVQARIAAPDGRTVAQAASAAITVAPGQVQVVEQTLPLGQAALWSIDTPQLY
ncbi:beta-galactosidase, partial [Xanthomonas perforans]|nr:beta-galactosidase [Xanthomonas perforans]